MNSERIKARFGSYHVRCFTRMPRHVWPASVAATTTRISAALAVTRFASPTPATLAEADALIREGDSIGSTLELAGQHLSREIIAEASVPLR